MAQQTINVGTAPNDGTGTPLRTAFQYTNSNFSELYTALGGGSGLPGASTQVLFNNGTNIAGDAGLVYNSTTDALTIGGNVQAASATITGDLTVATNTLKTTSGNVGIGTVTPDIFSRFYTRTIGFNSSGSTVMQINGTSYGGIDIGAAGTRTFGLTASASDVNFGSLTNIPIVFNINSSEAMRLNSTGLGVGGSPTEKLSVNGSLGLQNGGTQRWHISATSGSDLVFTRSTVADRFTITSDGNVGLGVSAFGTSAAKVLGLANATAPTTSPAGMGQLYVEAGALKYRGSSGTVTTIANA